MVKDTKEDVGASLVHGDYDLELPRVLMEIERVKAKRVLLQLPDGLKPAAGRIRAAIKKRYPAVDIVFWSGSCYGACDVPLHLRDSGFDLIIQFGHAPWRS